MLDTRIPSNSFSLDCLPELRELKLYDNHILHIKGMLALTALQSLDLSGNQVENIEVLHAPWMQLAKSAVGAELCLLLAAGSFAPEAVD